MEKSRENMCSSKNCSDQEWQDSHSFWVCWRMQSNCCIKHYAVSDSRSHFLKNQIERLIVMITIVRGVKLNTNSAYSGYTTN